MITILVALFVVFFILFYLIPELDEDKEKREHKFKKLNDDLYIINGKIDYIGDDNNPYDIEKQKIEDKKLFDRYETKRLTYERNMNEYRKIFAKKGIENSTNFKNNISKEKLTKYKNNYLEYVKNCNELPTN